MMKDQMNLNAKGQVKLELYNESGEVTFTKERKNLVVLSANEIVGLVMSDPARTIKATQTDKGDTLSSPNSSGLFEFQLSKNSHAVGVYTKDLGSSNTSLELVIPNLKLLVDLKKVTVAGVELVINKDVFIKDPEQGVLLFATLPLNIVSVEFGHLANAYADIVAGSLSIKVGSTAFAQSNVPSDINKTYAVDFKTGKVVFASAKAGVVAAYQFRMKYALGFMGTATKPAAHPAGSPVSFSQTDKLKASMEGEFIGARQLLQFPAVVSTGDPEIEVFPTKPISYLEKTVSLTGDGVAKNVKLLNTNKVLKLVSVKNVTDGVDVDIATVGLVATEGLGIATLAVAPELGKEIQVKFQEQLDSRHLQFELSEAPLLELISVKHQSLDNTVKAYTVANKGLTLGQGEVWITNQNKGFVEFSASPVNGPLLETPGSITFEYRVNSGTTVQFVADFPKGVPGPVLTEAAGEVIGVNSVQTTFNLQHTVTKDNNNVFINKVFKNGVELVGGYTISADGKQLSFTIAPLATDDVKITYSWLKATHDIYQVAMFAEQFGGKMFNISGIGPVTKDENTGMRITWSVTF